MNPNISRPQPKTDTWAALSKATVGKDVLELLSSSMYIEPLTIYREYIQNAIDSIDEARDEGLYKLGNTGQIQIAIDLRSRSVRIRDDGIGVRRESFESQLGTFGASLKRGTERRGFRGVGRLAGLAYCQILTFRTRAAGDPFVSEMLWDCRKIKKLLNTTDHQWSLEELLKEVVLVRQISGTEYPKHFFEVELTCVIRHKNDVLLNRRAIYDYLSEVAPVPFHPEFTFGESIKAELVGRVALGNVDIRIDDEAEPVYRPFRDNIQGNGQIYDEYTDIEFINLPALDEGDAGVMWLLHHSYKGAIPDKRLKGLRIRSGNIQIGSSDIFADVFVEPRFNSWTVGEVHVLDSRLTPNGRRDHFETGVHFDNLVNHIVPHTRKIGIRCRHSSQLRNRLREFDRLEGQVQQAVLSLSQDSLNKKARASFIARTTRTIETMDRCASFSGIEESLRLSLRTRIDQLRSQLEDSLGEYATNPTLESFPPIKRGVIRKVFGLIYECSDNPEAARKLIDRILEKLD